MADYTRIRQWIEKNTGCSLLEICQKFGYYSLAGKIVSLDESDTKALQRAIAKDKELRETYLAFSSDEKSKVLKKSDESWTQYFKRVITGWIVEDLTIERFKGLGIEIQHNGRDAQRKLLLGDKVRQDADFIVTVGNCSRAIELTIENNTFLEREGYIEKRAASLVKLYNNKGLWLYIDLNRGKYVLVDFGTESITLHLRHHKVWGKDVHRYVLAENNKKERDDRLLAAELISVVGCSIDGKEQPRLNELEDSDSPAVSYSIGGKMKKGKGVDKPIQVNKKPIPIETKKTEEKTKVMPKPQKAKPTAQIITKKVKPAPKPTPIIAEEPNEVMDAGFGDIDFV